MALQSAYLPNEDCRQLHIFSDGPASQTKNRFVLAILPQLRSHFHLQLLTWSFFATSHGKGPVDGVGGMAKRMVWQAVLSRRVPAVKNAVEFVTTMQQCSTNIQAILSTPEAEESALALVNAHQTFTSAPKIPNISLDHFWKCSDIGCERFPLSKMETNIIDLAREEAVESVPDCPLSPQLSAIDEATPVGKYC
jgi:hypothetical protein